jgi:hypothetical protein
MKLNVQLPSEGPSRNSTSGQRPESKAAEPQAEHMKQGMSMPAPAGRGGRGGRGAGRGGRGNGGGRGTAHAAAHDFYGRPVSATPAEFRQPQPQPQPEPEPEVQASQAGQALPYGGDVQAAARARDHAAVRALLEAREESAARRPAPAPAPAQSSLAAAARPFVPGAPMFAPGASALVLPGPPAGSSAGGTNPTALAAAAAAARDGRADQLAQQQQQQQQAVQSLRGFLPGFAEEVYWAVLQGASWDVQGAAEELLSHDDPGTSLQWPQPGQQSQAALAPSQPPQVRISLACSMPPRLPIPIPTPIPMPTLAPAPAAAAAP